MWSLSSISGRDRYTGPSQSDYPIFLASDQFRDRHLFHDLSLRDEKANAKSNLFVPSRAPINQRKDSVQALLPEPRSFGRVTYRTTDALFTSSLLEQNT